MCPPRSRSEPSGTSAPPSTISFGSVVVAPSRSTAQPAGIGVPARRAISIFPYAAAHVAMSMTIAGSCSPGNAMAIGFVPSIRSAPQSGATSLVVFVIDHPMRSRASASST